MLDNLIERGLEVPQRPRLYVVDGAKALSQDRFGGRFGRARPSSAARCTRGANFTDRLDESLHAGVRKVLRQA